MAMSCIMRSKGGTPNSLYPRRWRKDVLQPGDVVTTADGRELLVEEPGGLPGDVQNPQYWIARPHISVGGELYFT